MLHTALHTLNHDLDHDVRLAACVRTRKEATVGVDGAIHEESQQQQDENHAEPLCRRYVRC